MNKDIVVHVIAIVSVAINLIVYNIWLFGGVCR